jgi:hypothetical protein
VRFVRRPLDGTGLRFAAREEPHKWKYENQLSEKMRRFMHFSKREAFTLGFEEYISTFLNLIETKY